MATDNAPLAEGSWGGGSLRRPETGGGSLGGAGRARCQADLLPDPQEASLAAVGRPTAASLPCSGGMVLVPAGCCLAPTSSRWLCAGGHWVSAGLWPKPSRHELLHFRGPAAGGHGLLEDRGGTWPGGRGQSSSWARGAHPLEARVRRASPSLLGDHRQLPLVGRGCVCQASRSPARTGVQWPPARCPAAGGGGGEGTSGSIPGHYQPSARCSEPVPASWEINLQQVQGLGRAVGVLLHCSAGRAGTGPAPGQSGHFLCWAANRPPAILGLGGPRWPRPGPALLPLSSRTWLAVGGREAGSAEPGWAPGQGCGAQFGRETIAVGTESCPKATPAGRGAPPTPVCVGHFGRRRALCTCPGVAGRASPRLL